MLHYETINTKTLELLNKIQSVSIFKDLRLVGGTSLALQIGHRKSIDLDLFGSIKADEFSIIKELKKTGKVIVLKKSNNINVFLINDIKVDIVNYPYLWLNNCLLEDKIKLAKTADIGAMKLSAVTNRGTKRDFIDLYFLFKKHSLEKLLKFYKKKYDEGSVFLVLKSLLYFEDAETDEMPDMLQKLDWEDVKKLIIKKVSEIK